MMSPLAHCFKPLIRGDFVIRLHHLRGDYGGTVTVAIGDQIGGDALFFGESSGVRFQTSFGRLDTMLPYRMG